MAETFQKTCVLFVTTFIANLIQYLDRLLLLPILGGEAVSVYTVASFFGKSLGVLVTPLASVLLSYYAQKDFGMTTRRYWKINLSMIAFSTAFFLFCVAVGPFGTGIFYPTLIDAARPYILLANLAAVINVTCTYSLAADYSGFVWYDLYCGWLVFSIAVWFMGILCQFYYCGGNKTCGSSYCRKFWRTNRGEESVKCKG